MAGDKCVPLYEVRIFYKASLYYYRRQRGAEMRKGGDESRLMRAAPRCAPKARIKRARAAGSLHGGAV